MRGLGRRAGIITSEWCLDPARLLLTKVKDPLPAEKQANVVYEVPCTCGKVYTCETKRHLETAIAEHAWTEDHFINWKDMKILQCASSIMELVMKDALCIDAQPVNARFNQDSRYELPDCWMALKKIEGRSSRRSTRHRYSTT